MVLEAQAVDAADDCLTDVENCNSVILLQGSTTRQGKEGLRQSVQGKRMHVILAVTIGRHKLFGGSTPPGWNHMPRLLLRACCTLLPSHTMHPHT